MSLFVVVLVVVAGCTGGDTTSTYEAAPATVDESTASTADYQTDGPKELTLNTTLTLSNSTHTVVITSYGTHYAKNLTLNPGEEAPVALFTVVTSPNVSVGNSSINPLGNANHSEILQPFQANGTGISIDDRVGSTSVSVLGNRTNVSKFEGQIELSNNSTSGSNATVDVFVHVARFEHDDDHVIVVAAYPQSSPAERETILEMVRNLQHSD